MDCWLGKLTLWFPHTSFWPQPRMLGVSILLSAQAPARWWWDTLPLKSSNSLQEPWGLTAWAPSSALRSRHTHASDRTSVQLAESWDIFQCLCFLGKPEHITQIPPLYSFKLAKARQCPSESSGNWTLLFVSLSLPPQPLLLYQGRPYPKYMGARSFPDLVLVLILFQGVKNGAIFWGNLWHLLLE